MSEQQRNSFSDAYFDDLVVRYLENDLFDDELKEFEQMLAASPARCRQTAEWAHQAMLLQESLRPCPPEFQTECCPSRQSTAEERRIPGRRTAVAWRWHELSSPKWWAWGAAVVVLAALLLRVDWPRSEFGSGPAAIRVFVERGAAQVTHEITKCTWKQPLIPRLGEPLYPGRYSLSNGTALLLFHRGAEMLLEGPSELEIVNENTSILHQGRAVAVVPETAVGFRLDTPSSMIIDLGTEFGVEVAASGSTTLQVYKGEVIARLKDDGGPTDPRLVNEGEALQLFSQLNDAPFWPERFQRSLSTPDERDRSVRPRNEPRIESVVVVPAVEDVVIDGDLAEWDLSGRFRSSCDPPFDRSHYVDAAMMHDRNFLYLGAHIGDPYPMRNQISPLEAPARHAWGGGVTLRLSTDRRAGWPLTAESVVARQGRAERPEDLSDQLSFIVLWYFQPEGKACLQLRHGMDLHGLQVNPPGYKGAFREDPDGHGYTLEYAIPWRLLHAEADPPQGGDNLAAMWLVHWGDAVGRNWQGQLLDVANIAEQGWNFDRAATWGRATYLHGDRTARNR